MALFDFAHMGGEMVRGKGSEKKKKSLQPKGSMMPLLAQSVAEDEADLSASPSSGSSRRSKCEKRDPISNELDLGLALDGYTSSDCSDDDSDVLDSFSASTASESELSASEEASAGSRKKGSLWRRGKNKTQRGLQRALSFSFGGRGPTAPSNREQKEGSNSSLTSGIEEVEVVDKSFCAQRKARFQSIPASLSNSQALHAYSAGWEPAYRILSSMTCDDREGIMRMLFIKRKTDWYNDEVDSYNIIFKSVFGLQSRASTAMRQVGLLKKATWVHALLKSTTALHISAKLVYSSGDWRIPTRMSDGVTRKQALLATQDLDPTDECLLSKVEANFYTQLQRSVQSRLGTELADAVADMVIADAGEEHAAVFAQFLESRQRCRDKKARKARKGAKNKKSKQPAKQQSSRCDATTTVNWDATLDDSAEDFCRRAAAGSSEGGGGEPQARRGREADSEVESLETGSEPVAAAGAAVEASDLPSVEEELAKVACFCHPQLVANIEKAKPGFGRFAILLAQTFALKNRFEAAQAAQAVDPAQSKPSSFEYTNKSSMVKKLAVVGAKDGIIGLSLGVPLATFVNPFLGFPLMAMSLINLSVGSTELNIVETICQMQLHVLVLASNGTAVREFH